MINALVPPLPVSDQSLYRTGTLSYTKKGLLVLSLWLLWGDFAFTFFESIFGRFIPIYLKDLNASNTVIGLMTGSVAGVVNVLFLPGISRWSDNFRSSIGRRIPFLYVVTPLTVGSLIMVGFAPEIGEWLFTHFSVHLPDSVSKGSLILLLLGVFVVSFHFFNMVLVNGYTWLIRDVVPLEVMSLFLAWMRVVGTVSGTFFLWFVFPHLLANRREIFLGIGLFYLFAFLFMCRRVKEGGYPPVVVHENPPGFIKSFVVYFRDCFEIPLYRYYFIALLLINFGSGAGNFMTLFVKETLSVDMGGMGHIFAWSSAVTAVLILPLGWVCDRVSPIRIAFGALIVMGVMQILGYFLINDRNSFLVYTLISTLPSVAWGLGSSAMTMKLFPSSRFGQFSSALNVFGTGIGIVSNILAGMFMDFYKNDYRLSYLWLAVCYLAAIYPLIVVMRKWKQHGGPSNYVAPLLKVDCMHPRHVAAIE